jgi:hypothetical protein
MKICKDCGSMETKVFGGEEVCECCLGEVIEVNEDRDEE